MHVFAHNGTLPGIQQAEQFRLRRYQPVGTTDSEYAFCVLLDRLFGLWEANTPPTLEARLTLIAAFASQLRQLGPANFLYADSEILFAHGDRRIQVSDGSTRAPGLLLLERRCQDPKETLNASGMSTALSFQDSVLVASVALTNGPWRAFTEGELVAISLGKVLTSVVTAAVPTQVIELTLVGSGEPMIRMEKRLRCAAFALGVSLKLDHAIALDELGLRHDEIPALIHHGKVAMKGLARTEDIEVWLKNIKNESQPIYLDHR
jgi:glutamine amidotransferase